MLPVGATIALRNPILAILAGLWVVLLRNRREHSATGQSVPPEGGKDKGGGQAGRAGILLTSALVPAGSGSIMGPEIARSHASKKESR